MERNLGNSRRENPIFNGYSKPIKDPWSSLDNHHHHHHNHSHDYLLGFSWPPRSYSCSFCKREFRSAQALGGHMNVHRRDRAKLRLNENSQFINPNPNPNHKISSSLKDEFSPPPPPHPSPKTLISSTLASSSSSAASNHSLSFDLGERRSGFFSDIALNRNLKGLTKIGKVDESRINLELEMGLIAEPKQGLDLELRLGSAN